MAIKPILFNTEMVRAILNGKKTQTRRIAFEHDDLREFKSTAYPDGWWYECRMFKSFDDFLRNPQNPRCKYAPGDILWVRETWSTTNKCGLFPPWPSSGTHYLYKADDPESEAAKEARWCPSIHMPKEAARIFLRVKDVRVERVQEITRSDAIQEGVGSLFLDEIIYSDKDYGRVSMENGTEVEQFAFLWDSTIKKVDLPHYGWATNPWVWVIEFERCEKPEGWCEND